MFHCETAKEIRSCLYFFKKNERTDNDLLRSEVLRSYDQKKHGLSGTSEIHGTYYTPIG